MTRLRVSGRLSHHNITGWIGLLCATVQRRGNQANAVKFDQRELARFWLQWREGDDAGWAEGDVAESCGSEATKQRAYGVCIKVEVVIFFAVLDGGCNWFVESEMGLTRARFRDSHVENFVAFLTTTIYVILLQFLRFSYILLLWTTKLH